MLVGHTIISPFRYPVGGDDRTPHRAFPVAGWCRDRLEEAQTEGVERMYRFNESLSITGWTAVSYI
jgi:hypothetical protein